MKCTGWLTYLDKMNYLHQIAINQEKSDTKVDLDIDLDLYDYLKDFFYQPISMGLGWKLGVIGSLFLWPKIWDPWHDLHLTLNLTPYPIISVIFNSGTKSRGFHLKFCSWPSNNQEGHYYLSLHYPTTSFLNLIKIFHCLMKNESPMCVEMVQCVSFVN